MKVSCIIPVYNGQAYLEEALQSVFDQTAAPGEVLVVDDGSEDESPALAARYPVRVLSTARLGPAGARNRGVAECTGELVAFLDADDRWEPGKLARQLEALGPQAGICTTLVTNFWSPECEQRGDERLLAPWIGNTPSALLVRRSVFEQVGGFDESLLVGEDGDWLLRAHQAGVVTARVDEVLVRRRLHHRNLSRLRAAESRSQLVRRLKRHLDRQKT